MRFRRQSLPKPWRVSKTWTKIACLALAPLCLAAAQVAALPGAVGKLPPVTENGPVANGWQITAKADKHNYLPGDPIKVEITLKNVSGKEQMPWGYSDFSFAVFCNGVEMPATEYGVRSRQKWVGRRKLLYGANTNVLYASPGWILNLFHPGQAKVYKFAVNRFQDMTLDGAYKIVVKRDTSDSTQLVADPVYVQIGRAGEE